MVSQFKQTGQVMVEGAIVLMLLVLLLLGWQQLQPIAQQQQEQLVTNRKQLWSRGQPSSPVKVGGNYAGARYSGTLLKPITKLTDLHLPLNNYRYIAASRDNQYPMGRITNSWSAATEGQLAGQPRSLVVNASLAGDTAQAIQDALGGLPFAEELSSQQLIFGHIDTAVVPAESLKGRY